MARSNFRKGALPFEFVPMPKLILASMEWQSLPFGARALVLDLASQYTGKNNGRLTPAWEAMQRCGWTSKGTLMRAKAALLNTSFVVLTRKGHAPRTAEWVALTWWKLDFHESMDVSPRAFPYLNFKTVELARIDPNVGRNRPAAKPFMRSRNETDGPLKAGLRGPETRLMNGSEHGASVSKRDHLS